MTTFYLICFVLGFVLSVLAAFGGLGRVHFGHAHLGHLHLHGHAQAKAGGQMSALNGFTLPAFLGWFGAAGYLLRVYSSLMAGVVLVIAAIAGFAAASLLYVLLFRLLLPRERVLSAEETRMDGVVARVSDAIRAGGGTGEILFTQTGARKSAAARSETGVAIARGTEVVVLRYAHGIAYVSPLEELVAESAPGG
jgi:membrane protein implicated in regulation of membrane protease activity